MTAHLRNSVKRQSKRSVPRPRDIDRVARKIAANYGRGDLRPESLRNSTYWNDAETAIVAMLAIEEADKALRRKEKEQLKP